MTAEQQDQHRRHTPTPTPTPADAVERPAPTSGLATSSPDAEKNDGRSDGRDHHGGDNASETDDVSHDDDKQPPLPFSKARCIALVTTLTGASFLNASPHHDLQPDIELTDRADPVPPERRHYPAHHR